MRARASRLADRLMFGASVTTNMSQRIGRPLVHLPVRVTFNVSQLGCPSALEVGCLSPSVYNSLPMNQHSSESPPPSHGSHWRTLALSLAAVLVVLIGA